MSKLIMVVDDSATMLMSLKTNLEIAGYSVETATDGEDAMAKLSTGIKPDLIITDINMPKMNGLDLMRNARKLLRFVPIVALTTESQSSMRDEAKSLGATGWLVKPVSGNDLISVVKRVVPGA